MFCRNCGAKLDDDAVFCDKCGTVIKKDIMEKMNVNENTQIQLDSVETINPLDEQMSASNMDHIEKKKVKKRWIAVPCFIISGISLVMTIIQFVRKYNIEKQVYDILVKNIEEAGFSREILDTLGLGKTPSDYAIEAIIKSPFPYIMVGALIMGVLCLWLVRKK